VAGCMRCGVPLKAALCRIDHTTARTLLAVAGALALTPFALSVCHHTPPSQNNTPFAAITNGMGGNVRWQGVWLHEVLRAMYPEECKHPEGLHVLFDGADEYGASTPLTHVLDPQNDCMLATGMNNGPLLPDHGYPIRAVLPGIIGARNVKWVNSVRLARTSSESPWSVPFCFDVFFFFFFFIFVFFSHCVWITAVY
jgi:hypothetical protein